ncbi:MAG: hypothetical protein K0S33_2025 [Bacteroidetes bacterium]|jgi:hypothetical protein|nr:hypothetical protein [Bacteroidota bacterium]
MVKVDLEIRVRKTISIGEVIFYNQDLIAFYFNDDITIGVAEVKEMVYVTRELTGGEVDLLNLVVTGERNNISTQAFSYDLFKELNIKQRTVAEAVVIKNLPTRIMANFYYKAIRRSFPVKVFDSEEDAVSWLFSSKCPD